MPAVLVKNNIIWYANEWYHTQSSPVDNIPSVMLPWKPPQLPSVKINMDASWTSISQYAGLAAICRNHRGEWIKGYTLAALSRSPLHAELLIIKHTIEWCTTEQWDEVILASDCMQAVTMVLDRNHTPNMFSNLAYNCREAMEAHGRMVLRHEGRTTNKVADQLAKHARKNSTFHVTGCILNHPPLVCINALVEDKATLTLLDTG